MTKIIQYTLGMANGYFLAGDSGIVAVDCGSLLSLEAFQTVCRENGIALKDIRLLVVSHEHVDHFLNMGAMRALTGAPILCHRLAAASLRLALYPDVHPRNALGRKIVSEMSPDAEPCPYLPPMEPDLIFEGSFDLHPYGVAGKLIETPGHSRSCTSVLLESGEALVGDLLVDDFTGKATLAYFCYSESPDEANAQLFKSCETLLACAGPFYSGHGGPFTRAEFAQALSEAQAEAQAGE